MSDNSANNKRIAKNTILLYGRMLYSLFISLFTARVILNALGFEDYGLYNVIGSVVSMFVFLRSAMGNSVNRFITFALGKGDAENLNKIFSMSLIIHTALAIVIVILCEAVGVWFLNSHMEIPAGREVAANWVFQMSVFTCALSVICVPYDAEIIAHERMGIFAVIQVLNSTLNLAIAFAVKVFAYDKLIFYAFLLMMIQLMNRIVYGIYCGKHFPETKFHWVKDKQLLKEMTGFAGWSLLGNMAVVGYTQGLNIILNMFFGTAVNAARGIAVQVQGAIQGFVTNFQMAVNPQITKSYAQEDFRRMHSLIFLSSKLSFSLLFCLALPICIEVKSILHIWLGDYPEYAVVFTILTLITLLVTPLSNPICVANNATGKIKTFQIVEGGILLTILPIAYFVAKVYDNPVGVFLVQLVILYAVQIVRLFLVCHKINMSVREYCVKVLLRILAIVVVSVIAPILLYITLPKSIVSTISIIAISVLSVVISSYAVGLNTKEKRQLVNKVCDVINKLKKDI